MSKADRVLSNLKTGELGEGDYRRFLEAHSAAVQEALRKLGGFLQNYQPRESLLIRIIATGAQLWNLTAAMPKVKPPRPWGEAHGKYLKYLGLLDECLSLVSGMLEGKASMTQIEKKAAELVPSFNSVNEAIARVAKARGKA